MSADRLFDSSAILAYLKNEPGGAKVQKALISGGAISAANLAEVATYLISQGAAFEKVRTTIDRLHLSVFPIDKEMAYEAAAFITLSKAYGLSLGDRFCLALARRLNVPVYTADKIWVKIAGEINVKIELIR